ncbi:MAG: dihydroorotase, partial [Desulfatiglandales bacterium]
MLLIRNGNLVDTVAGRVEEKDVLIEGENVKALEPWGKLEAPNGCRVIDARGKLVVPGLMDMHVHLREPGEEYKETIETGSMAAAAGGFVAVASMPNTKPANDNASVTQFIIKRSREVGLIRVFPIASITVGQKGERLSEFGELREAGAVGVSDDGRCVVNSELMRRAMEYASFFGLRVISHCEDHNLSEGGQMHEGVVSTKLGLRGIPAEAEEIMVFREIALSKLTGLPVHIAHVSTKGSVELIRWAKSMGIEVTAETAPHYFALDHREIEGYNTLAKVNPPLRSEEDREAIKTGLREGVIDVIATDHAPHSPLE